MAITNAQQYQQLVNKPASGKRPGYRGGQDLGASASGMGSGKLQDWGSGKQEDCRIWKTGELEDD